MDHNIVHQHYHLSQKDRITKYGFSPKLLWFTGLSGSGKSTLANLVEAELFKLNQHTYILDGDNVRGGLNSDLDFSEQSRKENIRRLGEVSNLFLDAGVTVLTAFISPFKEDRIAARNKVGAENFIEIFVDCPLEVCEARDVKGLYAKARAGKIPNFTGIDSPFEAPENPEIHVNTHLESIETCVAKIMHVVTEKTAV